MINLKFIIPVLIVFILIVGGVYYYWQTQISDMSDLNFPSNSPNTTFRSATPSASTQGQTLVNNNPRTGPEDDLNLTTQITITNPTQAAYVSSPLKVTGFANITSQIVELVLYDSEGNVLGESRATACLSYAPCEFLANLAFTKPKTTTGVLKAYSKSTIDNSPQDITSQDINFN